MAAEIKKKGFQRQSVLGLSALLQGVWPKTTLLSKACHDLLFYGTCGLYQNFSTGGDKWATSPTVLF